MTSLTKAFVLCLVIFSITVNAAESNTKITIAIDKNGLWGAKDAKGTTLVSYKYNYVSELGAGYFMVGLTTKNETNSEPNDYGVVDSHDNLIIPIKYSNIHYNRDFKRFRVMLSVSGGLKLGYYDDAGKIVIPVIYDEMERISNMGDEPVNVVKLKEKYGYINLITGKLMIPVEYDKLYVGSLTTDAQGNGIAMAAKHNKYGIISTDGAVIVPFEFDGFIDHIDTKDGGVSGTGEALQNGKLVTIRFDHGKYLGASEQPNIYSSALVPPINPKPFDGLYKAEDYPDMKSAWDAWRNDKLRWLAIPSIQINGDFAYVAFGQFTAADKLGLQPRKMGVTKQKNGFTIITDDEKKKTVKANFLSFTQSGDVMICNECANLDLPVRWRLVKTDKPQEFVGIGVAINKANDSHAFIYVAEVLNGGFADKAGLKAGDYITKIDGVETLQYSGEQAKDKLRGELGSKVTLEIVRNGKPLAKPVVVTRGLVKYN